MAGIIAGSIGGWTPIERPAGGNEGDTAPFGRGRSRSDLSKEPGLDVHPETSQEEQLTIPNPVETAGNQAPSQSQLTTPAMGLGPFAKSSHQGSSKAGKGLESTVRERSPTQ